MVGSYYSEKEIKEMMQNVKDNAYATGFNDGYDKGFEIGYDNGMCEGELYYDE